MHAVQVFLKQEGRYKLYMFFFTWPSDMYGHRHPPAYGQSRSLDGSLRHSLSQYGPKLIRPRINCAIFGDKLATFQLLD